MQGTYTKIDKSKNHKMIVVNDRLVLVSQTGIIFLDNGNGGWRQLKQSVRGHGYSSVAINRKRMYVHRLVAYAFNIIPTLQKIEGLDVDHINNDPSNNCVENLRLISSKMNREKEAELHRQQLDYLYVANFNDSKGQPVVIVARSLSLMAKELNIDKSYVSQIVRGERNPSNGLKIKKIDKCHSGSLS